MEQGVRAEHKYFRVTKKFPVVWCPGCGIGIVMGALIRAINRMELDKDKVVLVSGIGCSGRIPVYLDFNTLHTTHGRALSFATGIKFANPALTVIVIMGDGDATAIGGNHFIHTCRRNIDINAIVINNCTYGMTGGQYSPTTPFSALSTTSRYGNIEQPFDICELATGSGATFVARSTTYQALLLDRLIEKAIRKKGFSVIEAIANCNTAYGRTNRLGSAVDMMKWEKECGVMVDAWGKMTAEERKGKFAIGLLKDIERPEYTEEFDKITRESQNITA